MSGTPIGRKASPSSIAATTERDPDVLYYLYFERPEVESVACTIIREGVRSTLTLPVR